MNRFCIEKCKSWCCKNRAKVIVDGRVGRFFIERRRCENLKDDNTCSVYEDRPDVCREYFCDKIKKLFPKEVASIEKIKRRNTI